MKYSVEGIKDWIQKQICHKDSPTSGDIQSWYKYAKQCPQWKHLTYGDAPAFCKLAKIAGKDINEEFGYDVIKLHFYGIWKHNELKGQNEWEQNWVTHPNGEQIV